MGRIKKLTDRVVVEMDLSELLVQKTYVKLPNEERLWVNHLADLISRAAGNILHKKAPQFSKTYHHITIEGEGKVIINFFEEELP